MVPNCLHLPKKESSRNQYLVSELCLESTLPLQSFGLAVCPSRGSFQAGFRISSGKISTQWKQGTTEFLSLKERMPILDCLLYFYFYKHLLKKKKKLLFMLLLWDLARRVFRDSKQKLDFHNVHISFGEQVQNYF